MECDSSRNESIGHKWTPMRRKHARQCYIVTSTFFNVMYADSNARVMTFMKFLATHERCHSPRPAIQARPVVMLPLTRLSPCDPVTPVAAAGEWPESPSQTVSRVTRGLVQPRSSWLLILGVALLWWRDLGGGRPTRASSTKPCKRDYSQPTESRSTQAR